jgi:diguanylate cyclase (GGDEF)-like protein
MIVAPQPINERQRLAALLRYEVLDSAPERAYDDIVTLAAQICGTPVALMGLVDTDRVWHKARIGVPVEEAPRATSFCQHTILQDVPLAVPDTARDERFRDSPIVVDGPRIRFYAGAPLLTGDGHAVGTLCAMDTVPRELSAEQMDALAALSRQVVAQLELRRLLSASRREALTDPLTELGNRRRLMVDFEELLLDATSEEPVHMLFFDLDGFKAYNDTFGHGAGDALLSRLAGKLAAAVTEHGSAYRIGGDEFCALLRVDSGELDALRRAASVALSEHGEGFSITTSHGAVTLPDEATTATRALQLADARMYGDKAGRSQQASRQTHDALLRVLNERDPELQTHGDSVSRLAVAVGARLGLNADTLDLLGRAAALHDIGKVAVPDAILTKPGALTPEEWDFMRTHTLLGERILAAAPSLREEAALVRSSHERWDGAGYPDQRAGTDIPLGSRIIFACDAYDAMTSPRVYRTARTPAQALRELDRCAGSQFDPVVVAALQAELAATPRSPASSAQGAARSQAS